MTTLKDLYTGGIAPGISQGMQWAGQAQAIQGAKTRNALADLALQNEPTRLSNQNRLADLVAQGKEQAINQNAQAQGVTNLDLLRRALEGFGPISEIQDDETANQRFQLARTVLGNAGVDLTGMPETTTAQELQAVGGMNGAAGNNGVQSTFTTNDGKLGYVTRDGRTVVTDQKVQRSYQVRDYGDQPFVFDSKTGAIMPVSGAAGDAAADAAARERQAKVEQERQIAQAKEGAKLESAQNAAEQGAQGTLQILDDMEALANKPYYTGSLFDQGEQAVRKAGINIDDDKAANTIALKQYATNLKFAAKPKDMGAMTEGEWQIIRDAIPDPATASPEELRAGIQTMRRMIQIRQGKAGAETQAPEKSVNWDDL